MTIIQKNFDKLYTIASDVAPPIVVDNKMVIPARNLGAIPGHPLNPAPQETIFIPKCYLVFEGVKKSIRELWHYVADPPESGHFKTVEPSSSIVDGPFPELGEPVESFLIEGVMLFPHAWVSWEIESVSFYLELDSTNQPNFIEKDLIQVN
ncbi:MAG: hypothetical protein MUE44_05195 [Oscillatoriaceae cyanobacterium Prado104]|jgi:hypothetical protein|nr:hypothetical protein [Oscillatoriaceae cyanobacterium Prado104]